METIPEFAYPTFGHWLCGFGGQKITLNPTVMCKYEGEAYVSVRSLNEFCSIIQNVSTAEQESLHKALKDLMPYSTINSPPVIMVKVSEVDKMRVAGNHFINRYLDHLKEIQSF